MNARRIAQFFVGGLFVFSVAFATWAILEYRQQRALVAQLYESGDVVSGTIVRLHKSEPSAGSSASGAYIIDVSYNYAGQVFTNPYAVPRSRWERLSEGESIDITVLPSQPRLSALTDVVTGDSDHSGFVVQD